MTVEYAFLSFFAVWLSKKLIQAMRQLSPLLSSDDYILQSAGAFSSRTVEERKGIKTLPKNMTIQ